MNANFSRMKVLRLKSPWLLLILLPLVLVALFFIALFMLGSAVFPRRRLKGQTPFEQDVFARNNEARASGENQPEVRRPAAGRPIARQPIIEAEFTRVPGSS